MLAVGPGHATPVSLADFAQLSLRCGPTVAPLTLASVARTESRFQPLTISDNTIEETAVPATLPIAAQIATQLIAAGHSVDLGIMQINSRNLARLGLTPALALDPCHSIAAAAKLLTDDYAGGETHAAQQAALRNALSEYNTGDSVRGYANGYVHKVELAARAVVPAIDVGVIAPGRPVEPAPATAAAVTPVSWDVWAQAGDRSAAEQSSTIFSDGGGGSVLSVTPGSKTER